MAKSFGNDNTPRHVRKRELDRFGIPYSFNDETPLSVGDRHLWVDVVEERSRQWFASVTRVLGESEARALFQEVSQGKPGRKKKLTLSDSDRGLLRTYDDRIASMADPNKLAVLPREIAEEIFGAEASRAAAGNSTVSAGRAKAIETQLRRLVKQRRDDQARDKAWKAAWMAGSYLPLGLGGGPVGATALSIAPDDD